VMAARTCVILPVKTFAQGKTRLRAQLSDHARAGLARDMFLGVLHASQHCAQVSATYVVTNGADVAALLVDVGQLRCLQLVAREIGRVCEGTVVDGIIRAPTRRNR